MLGIYIHIPFCAKKCPYCDFYSENYSKKLSDSYTDAVISAINSYKQKNLCADTLYFGGGTPNLIGYENIRRMIDAVKNSFILSDDAEITLEANPESFCKQDISAFKKAGINRLSLGLQSANQKELKNLNRRHSLDDVKNCILSAKQSGIDNISLDLMVGIEGQNIDTLEYSIDFCVKSGVEHISAYLLKIEPNTPFYENRLLLNIPNDDNSADLYEFLCKNLTEKGFEQYEISNFAKNSKTSRHNTKYWLCEEYIGIGAAAHGFFEGERYYYERDINAFIENPLKTVYDGEGGDFKEAFMLNLRLSNGVKLKSFTEKYHCKFTIDFYKNAENFEKMGLMIKTGDVYALTQKGFLLSNTIIATLLDYIEK